MMTLLKWLQRSHEIMSSRNTGSDDTLGNTSRDGSLYNSSHRVHRPNDLVLELRRHMKLDLLEEVLGGAKPSNDEHILRHVSFCGFDQSLQCSPVAPCSAPESQ